MGSATDDIWNRALDHEWAAALPGDVALRNVLTFDGTVSNGGLWYAIELHAVDEEFPLDAIVDGFRTFGLESAASVVERAAAEYEQTAGIGDEDAWGDAEERINDEYTVGTDDLALALERTLAADPDLFAPID